MQIVAGFGLPHPAGGLVQLFGCLTPQRFALAGDSRGDLPAEFLFDPGSKLGETVFEHAVDLLFPAGGELLLDALDVELPGCLQLFTRGDALLFERTRDTGVRPGQQSGCFHVQ